MYLIQFDFYLALATELGRMAGWLCLVVLPGSLITFGLNSPSLPFWIRICTGIALSPLVVCVEFYLFRLTGVAFESTVILLVIVNFPAMFLIWKEGNKRTSLPGFRAVLGSFAVLMIALLCLSPQLLDSTARTFNGHTWMHADIVYMISNGDLWPHDPELYGVQMAYPWIGHIYQATLSYLLGSSPTSNFIWTNAVWLASFLAFTVYTVAEFTDNRLTQISSFIWLILGLNFLGHILMISIPDQDLVSRFWVGGDYRYTPWILKFYFFEQIIFGLAMFAAVTYLCVRRQGPNAPGNLALMGLLLVGIGLIYPIIFAPALCVVMAKLVLQIYDTWQSEEHLQWSRIVMLGFTIIATSSITFFYLQLLTSERVTPSIHLPSLTSSFLKTIVLKSHGTFVAISVFIFAAILVTRKYWKVNRDATFVLLCGGVASLLLNLLLEIPYWGNEYKFLFTAAICLSPFPPLALEPVMNRLGKNAIAGLALITTILLAPFAHKILHDFPWRKTYGHSPEVYISRPAVNSDNFALVLERHEKLANLAEAIRTQTTIDTILVIERSEIHFPTITQRRLYAPPAQEDERQGVNIESMDLLANIRGYGKTRINERREVLNALFLASAGTTRTNALSEIRELQQPFVIVLELPRHTSFLQWLNEQEQGRMIFNDGEGALWYISPH